MLTGRDSFGAVPKTPEKYQISKGGVEILREGRQSQSGPRGRGTKFCQFGQDGLGQTSTSDPLTDTFLQFHLSSPSGPHSSVVQRGPIGRLLHMLQE